MASFIQKTDPATTTSSTTTQQEGLPQKDHLSLPNIQTIDAIKNVNIPFQNPQTTSENIKDIARYTPEQGITSPDLKRTVENLSEIPPLCKSSASPLTTVASNPLDTNTKANRYNQMASALNSEKRYGGAKAAAKEGLLLKPSDINIKAGLYLNKTFALNGEEKYNEAKAAAEEGFSLHPSDSNIKAGLDLQIKTGLYLQEASALNDQKKYEEAKAAAQAGLLLHPSDINIKAGLYLQEASALNGLGKHDEAWAVARQWFLLELPCSYTRANLCLQEAKALNGQKKYAEAERIVGTELILDPIEDKGTIIELHLQMIIALYRQGKNDQAAEIVEELRERVQKWIFVDPNDTKRKTGLYENRFT